MAGPFLVAPRSELGLSDWPDESALRTIATNGRPLIDKTVHQLDEEAQAFALDLGPNGIRTRAAVSNAL